MMRSRPAAWPPILAPLPMMMPVLMVVAAGVDGFRGRFFAVDSLVVGDAGLGFRAGRSVRSQAAATRRMSVSRRGYFSDFI